MNRVGNDHVKDIVPCGGVTVGDNVAKGYFVGKRVVFPDVKNYMRNARKKYGIGNGDVLHAVRVEYDWKPPRCGDDSKSDVEDVYSETAWLSYQNEPVEAQIFIDASLLKDEDYNVYDGYENEDFDLTKEHSTLCNAFDINLRCQS
ncbi:hypothetical protein Tco_0857100 [Tanacetum coccineum]|uniref:Uncharacterized protein n=1 Tax=Tanacetum coccineum TaxID=301880 RepID=A0ABQ5B6B2_9ASTR